MGHRYLGQLPETLNWQKVVDLLSITKNPAAIAKATCEAAIRGLEIAKKDPGVAATVYYLIKFVWSAQKDNFLDEMSRLSISCPPKASLLDIITAFDNGVNQRLRNLGHRTDLAEMARLSAVDAMVGLCQSETASLFETTLEDTVKTLKNYATTKEFSIIGKRFFGKFLYRFLDYHLSREIPNHIGSKKTFSTVAHAQRFKNALELHCYETARIVQEFSGCWPSATEYNDQITEVTVRNKFLPVAFNKINAEMKKRGRINV